MKTQKGENKSCCSTLHTYFWEVRNGSFMSENLKTKCLYIRWLLGSSLPHPTSHMIWSWIKTKVNRITCKENKKSSNAKWLASLVAVGSHIKNSFFNIVIAWDRKKNDTNCENITYHDMQRKFELSFMAF